MNDLRRSIALGTAVFVILFIVVAGFPVSEPAEAANVEAYIELHQESQEMPVQAGVDRTVSFTGTVTCNLTGMGAGWEEVRVTLNGRTTSGWVVSIAPSEMTFETGGEPQGFTVTVNAPVGSLPQTTQDTLTIDGSADEVLAGFVVTSYNIAPVSASITIQQYYGVETACQDPVREAGSSDSVTYIVKVKNKGNGMDTFYVNRVDYSRNPEMPDRGFKVSFEPEELLLTGNAEADLVVTLTTPKDTPESKVYNFTIYVRSKGAEDSGKPLSEDSESLVLQTKGGLADLVGDGGLIKVIVGGAVVLIVLVVIVIIIFFAVRKVRGRKRGAP